MWSSGWLNPKLTSVFERSIRVSPIMERLPSITSPRKLIASISSASAFRSVPCNETFFRNSSSPHHDVDHAFRDHGCVGGVFGLNPARANLRIAKQPANRIGMDGQ